MGRSLTSVQAQTQSPMEIHTAWSISKPLLFHIPHVPSGAPALCSSPYNVRFHRFGLCICTCASIACLLSRGDIWRQIYRQSPYSKAKWQDCVQCVHAAPAPPERPTESKVGVPPHTPHKWKPTKSARLQEKMTDAVSVFKYHSWTLVSSDVTQSIGNELGHSTAETNLASSRRQRVRCEAHDPAGGADATLLVGRARAAHALPATSPPAAPRALGRVRPLSVSGRRQLEPHNGAG